jgi:sugar diacid utilization regulator
VTAEIQELIEDLADRLGVPAMLEDREERVVAYSSQSSPVDEVRRQSILRRKTEPEVMAWFRSFGILQATDPLRIPSHPKRGILGRLCVPVRFRSRLMGFVWLIDDDEALGEGEVTLAQGVAEQLALLMYEEELDHRLTSRILSQLLSSSEELREAAINQIAGQGLFPTDTPCVVVVLVALGVPGPDAHEPLCQALWDVGREAGPGGVLHMACSDHGIVLVQSESRGDDERATRFAERGREALARRLSLAPARVIAALGDPQARLSDAIISYRQARLAVRVGAAVPGLGDLLPWRRLGAFRVLAQLPSDQAMESSLDPRLLALFATGDAEAITTLETYLDLAGDAKATADRLYLHRATLYYRLNKVERLTGISLKDGHDRLAMHLGLKLSRLCGLHPVPDAGSGEQPRSGATA